MLYCAQSRISQPIPLGIESHSSDLCPADALGVHVELEVAGHTPEICEIWPLKPLPGFPGGLVVENLPASTGDRGLTPGLGRSHRLLSSWVQAPKLWSLCSRAHRLRLLEPVICNQRSRCSEKPVPCEEGQQPQSSTRESMLQWRASAIKNKQINKS